MSYKGKIGPADAMSALAPEFMAAYGSAAQKIFDAVLEFERATGRVVSDLDLEVIDVTKFASKVPQHIRQARIDFLPRPGEVDW